MLVYFWIYYLPEYNIKYIVSFIEKLRQNQVCCNLGMTIIRLEGKSKDIQILQDMGLS